ncbi:MAG: hypothetical protein WBX25_26545, partial [Rhodomicrobium sp.]
MTNLLLNVEPYVAAAMNVRRDAENHSGINITIRIDERCPTPGCAYCLRGLNGYLVSDLKDCRLIVDNNERW